MVGQEHIFVTLWTPLHLAAKQEKKWMGASITKARDIESSLAPWATAPMQSASATILGEPQHSPGRPRASPGSASVQVWDTLGPALAQAPIPIQILTAPCVNLRSIPGLDTNRKYVLGWVGGEAQVAGLGAWPEPG